MSAKKAAASIIANDPYVRERAMVLLDGESYSPAKGVVGKQLLRDVMETWTLTLAADAAGVPEEQVIGAMAYQLKLGSIVVARHIARELFSAN